MKEEEEQEAIRNNPTRQQLLDNEGYKQTDKGWHRATRMNRTLLGVDYFDQQLIEELIAKKGQYRQKFEEIVKRKNYIRTDTFRLVKKLNKNIHAVECGKFQLGLIENVVLKRQSRFTIVSTY